MELRQLEYVVALAEELNFTRAAARCHIVQSGLSAQIAKLERELGTAIFVRTSRSVGLTPAGEVLLAAARTALQAVAGAQLEIVAMSGAVRGVLRLGAMASHTTVDLPHVLATFHWRYPDVDVEVRDGGSMALLEELHSGALDVAFLGVHPEQLPPSLDGFVVLAEPLVAVVELDNPLADRPRVDLADLAETSRFIECRADSGVRHQVDRAFARARAVRRVSFELGSVAEVARLASLGLGAAVVPRSVAEGLGPGEGFRVLPLTDTLAQQAVSLVFRPLADCSLPVRLFVDLYRVSAAEAAGR